MDVVEYLRVVSLRKGKIQPAEFYIRKGEIGLSLFARLPDPGPAEIMAAVRTAGKQGDLGIARLDRRELISLGIRIKKTPGGTADPRINDIHYEARLSFVRRLLLFFRGIQLHDYFNETIGKKLSSKARLLD